MDALVTHGTRLLAVSLAVAGALWLCSRSSALGVAARWGLYALVVGDLLFTHINVNPTMSADLLSTPSWVASTREHPTDRVYIGRGERSVEGLTIDAPPTLDANPNAPPTVVAALRLATLSFMPSGYGVREPISRDMSALRSAEYLMMSSQFHQPGQGAERGRFLARTATRYYVLGAPPIGDFRLVADIPNLSPLAVYELTSVRPRAVVAPAAVVEPDLMQHVLAMMAAEFDPRSAALLEIDPPDPSGSPGAGVAAAAAIEGESANTVTVRAGAPEGGGYLVLMDSYDPGWTAEVDGEEATVLKANGLFRAVRLAPGEHVVRFEYRPVSLYVGAGVSLATALGLLLACWWARRRAIPA
jgi:hypothetical protein